MKGTISGIIMLSIGLALCWHTDLRATDIYKTFDENGDPVYTDQPPTPESKPITLRELSVVDAPTYSRARTTQQSDPADAPPSMNELRRTFRDFRMVSPAPEQNIWGTGNTVTLAWDAGAPLMEGMSVIFYIDGQAVTQPTSEATFTSGQLDRGQHTAKVDLIDANNTVLVSAPTVTFYIMQQSVNNQSRRVP